MVVLTQSDQQAGAGWHSRPHLHHKQHCQPPDALSYGTSPPHTQGAAGRTSAISPGRLYTVGSAQLPLRHPAAPGHWPAQSSAQPAATAQGPGPCFSFLGGPCRTKGCKSESRLRSTVAKHIFTSSTWHAACSPEVEQRTIDGEVTEDDGGTGIVVHRRDQPCVRPKHRDHPPGRIRREILLIVRVGAAKH